MFQQDIFQGPGTGTFTTHTFEILFMLLVAFLLGIWLGWILWSRYKQTAERLRTENDSLNITNATLRGDMDKLTSQLTNTETERSTAESQWQNQQLELDNTRNQLTVLERDMEKILQRNRQLETELGLAKTSGASAESTEAPETVAPLPAEPVEEFPDLETVADEAAATPEMPADVPEEGTTMLVIDPDLEREAEALEAEAPAETFDEPSTTPPAAPEAPAKKEPQKSKAKSKSKGAGKTEEESVVAAVVSGPKDDLKIVEGIGPKIEELLFKAGITSYGQLAATGVQQLKDILDAAGPRFAMHDPGTWSAQALLAANGEWDNLKAYQDFLNAGKRPDK